MEARGLWATFATLVGGAGIGLMQIEQPVPGWSLFVLSLFIFVPVLHPSLGTWATTPIRNLREARRARKQVDTERQLRHTADSDGDGSTRVLTLRREDGAVPGVGTCEVTSSGVSYEAGFGKAVLDEDSGRYKLVMRFPDDFEDAPQRPWPGRYEVVWKQGYMNPRSRFGEAAYLQPIATDSFDYVLLPEPSTVTEDFPAARYIRHKKDCPDTPRLESFFRTRQSGKQSIVTRCIECGEQVEEMPGWKAEHSEMTSGSFGHGLLLSVSGGIKDGIRSLRCLVAGPIGNNYQADPSNIVDRTDEAEDNETFHFPGQFKASPLGGWSALPPGKYAVTWLGLEPDDALGAHAVYVAADSFTLLPGGVVGD